LVGPFFFFVYVLAKSSIEGSYEANMLNSADAVEKGLTIGASIVPPKLTCCGEFVAGVFDSSPPSLGKSPEVKFA